MSKLGYRELSQHYGEMLDLFDVVHFNSDVTRSVYLKHTNVKESTLLPITNKNVEDNRRARSYEPPCLKLLFIGSSAHYKGFPMLEQALSELYGEGHRSWQLDVWGDVGSSPCELIEFKGGYKPEDLKQIYHNDALLITPSLWHETFSLTTLEALSYGIPTLVSSTVGAKDIVADYDEWFIFSHVEDLKSKLLELLGDRSRLREFNQTIITKEWHHSLSAHAKEIMKLYY
ncbi:MAG: glycosyltransferase family 4 protein [Rikenellaceae bacterium]